jgi:hypothetical protein
MQRLDTTLAAAMSAVLLGPSAAGPARAEVVETRMLEESVPVDDVQALRVVVENIFGSIRVTAHDRAVVEMTATETIRAETQSDLDRARAESVLRTERGDSLVAFLVPRDDDANWGRRNRWSGWNGWNRWSRWNGYVVEYDIELRVPREAAFDLSTVNGGEIVVDGVWGAFDVANVNGAVSLRGLRGTGSARTVNGPLEASFEQAPATGTSFKTVNGRIEVEFPRELSADLAFMTMHGEIWTDFDAEPVAASPVRERTQDGDRFVIRSERRSVIRVASGGPIHSFETLNGEIYVREVSR